MKRFFIIAITLILCLSCLSCQKTEDMSQVYTDAKAKTDSLLSFDAEMELSMIFESNGEKSGTESVVTTSLDRRDENAPVYYTRYAVTDIELDYEYISSTYFADETVYELTAMGEKYKAPVSVDSIESLFSGIAMDFPADAFKKATVKGENVSVKVEYADVSELCDALVSGMDGRFTAIKPDGSFDYDYSDITLGFATDENGYFSEMSVEFEADFEHSEGKSKVDFFQKIRFNSPGEEITVIPPDDLDQYTFYEQQNLTPEQQEEQFMEDILSLFIFEDGTAIRVENFDTLYAQFCAKYGKDAVDSYVETVEMLGMLGNME